jgi:hypothetical protein
MASKALPAATLDYLQRGGETLPERFVRVVAGDRADPLSEIVDASLQAAIDQDLTRASRRGNGAPVGIRVEHRLLEAMRMLTREKWTTNVPGARIWFTHEGVFLSWKAAANDIAIRLRAEGVMGAPRDPDTMAELLLAHGVLCSNPLATGALKHYYKLLPHLRGTPRQAIEVVRLVDPELIGLRAESANPIDAEFATGKSDLTTPIAARATRDPLTLPLDLPAPPSHSSGSSSGADAQGPHPAVPVSAQQVPTPAELAPQQAVGNQALPVSQEVTPPPSVPSESRPVPNEGGAERRPDLKPLERFGEAGRILRKLAERLLQEPTSGRVWRLDEGVAVAYPEGIADFCEKPQLFLTACESQGLLVPDSHSGGRVLRVRRTRDPALPAQYVVLSPRVSKYLHVPVGP